MGGTSEATCTHPVCTPRVLDQTIALRAYEGPLRQLIVAGLGHEDPTFLLTNQLRRSPATLIERYAQRIRNGYGQAKSCHLFWDFIDAVARVSVTAEEIQVRFQKCAHNPLLRAAGFGSMNPAISWLGGKRLRILLGETSASGTGEIVLSSAVSSKFGCILLTSRARLCWWAMIWQRY